MKSDNQTNFANSANEPAKNEQTFSISELAKEFDITTRSIRFYEDQGLISPERNGQTRIYSKRDKVRLKLILRGKRLGLPWLKQVVCLNCMMLINQVLNS